VGYFENLRRGQDPRYAHSWREITISARHHHDLPHARLAARCSWSFPDANTNGDSTYSVGRFIAPERDGTFTLVDFKLVPFSILCVQLPNCPMPLKQNRFTVPIEAGVREAGSEEGWLTQVPRAATCSLVAPAVTPPHGRAVAAGD
jgi:hypothetical protein